MTINKAAHTSFSFSIQTKISMSIAPITILNCAKQSAVYSSLAQNHMMNRSFLRSKGSVRMAMNSKALMAASHSRYPNFTGKRANGATMKLNDGP